ncbi:MAG: hypothetical protein KDE51_05525, partial [Anaerolineales bacterium]|nr:hypothetical protein [Anaerolineales bacterium]
APILSTDAQVVIYETSSFFAPNGVKTLQVLPSVPQQESHPWLVPVGQAYRVALETFNSGRYISFNFLQRDVPEGYETTLTVYFLPDCPAEQPNCAQEWQRLEQTERFVENLIVAPLQTTNGVYAIMATIKGPALQAGWNLLTYPLLDTRCVGECPPAAAAEGCLGNVLASIKGQYNGLSLATVDGINLTAPVQPSLAVNYLEPQFVYWIHITEAPATPYFAPPKRAPDGNYPDCQLAGSGFKSFNYLPMIHH